VKKLILIVIDGLTPAEFERAAEDDRTPALKFLAANGNYARGTSTFPSLTPVCLSSIATGAHPDVHRIPHLVWYDRSTRRIVEARTPLLRRPDPSGPAGSSPSGGSRRSAALTSGVIWPSCHRISSAAVRG